MYFRGVLILAMFSGFKVVLGWQGPFQDKLKWALELSTYAGIVMFVLLFAISRWVLGETAFQRRDLDAGDVVDGMAPIGERRPEVEGEWRKAINAVLDFI